MKLHGAACLLLLACLPACTTVRDQSEVRVVAHWNDRFAGPYPLAEGGDPATRRAFTYEGIAVKDYEYRRYVDTIRRGVSWSGFGAQAIAIGLNTAGSLATGGATQILAGAAGAVTGTNAAFSRNVLFDQSITTFISKMAALRAAKLAEIERHLEDDSVKDYSFAQAYRDVQVYGNLGTLDAALAAIASNSVK